MDLISGATGFIGQRLFHALQADGLQCRRLVRKQLPGADSHTADLADKTALTAACSGIEKVFHCAGYAHAFSSDSGNDLEKQWQVNFEGTRNLVEAAGQAGVRRFLFLSSVKAMARPGNVCIDEDFSGEPETAYGQAKLAAEQAVLDAGTRYGMHVVNLRLAMAYGAGGHGNLERMGRLVRQGLFPPLPETGNHRSLVHVADVVAALRLVAQDDRAAGRTYIVASPTAPSGRELFDALRTAMDMPHCSWEIHGSLLRFAGSFGDVFKKLSKRRLPLDSESLDRLLGSAWYSPARIERELGWRAQIALADGLSEMFRSARSG